MGEGRAEEAPGSQCLALDRTALSHREARVERLWAHCLLGPEAAWHSSFTGLMSTEPCGSSALPHMQAAVTTGHQDKGSPERRGPGRGALVSPSSQHLGFLIRRMYTVGES